MEDEFSIWEGLFSGAMLKFWGGYPPKMTESPLKLDHFQKEGKGCLPRIIIFQGRTGCSFSGRGNCSKVKGFCSKIDRFNITLELLKTILKGSMIEIHLCIIVCIYIYHQCSKFRLIIRFLFRTVQFHRYFSMFFSGWICCNAAST